MYEDWLYYMKKEQEATSSSTKAVYSRLKELHRDKIVVANSNNSETTRTILEYLEKQIRSNEEKLSILMNLEVDLPEFYD